MNNEQYEPYWQAFLEAATPLMERLRAALGQNYPHLSFAPLELVDHDVDRGLGFGVEGDEQPGDQVRYVELMLVDGGEHGYEGVGLKLDCSGWLAGMVWAPYNFTEQVGTTDLNELRQRIQALPVPEVAAAIAQEWERIAQLPLSQSPRPAAHP